MRIVLADDHELVRAGLKPFLAELAADVQVEEHSDLGSVLAAREPARAGDGVEPIDLVIVDLRMPGVEGADSLSRVARAYAPAPVVVLSASQATEDILMAARRGMAGYLPKTMSGPVMVAALRLVLLGERYFPAVVLDSVREETPSDGGQAVFGAGDTKENPLDLLSARERQILERMIEGQTNKAIARDLSLQEITVKVHLRNIYRKMGAANRTQAVRIALQNGWKL